MHKAISLARKGRRWRPVAGAVGTGGSQRGEHWVIMLPAEY